jgi:hypothetical protein
MQCWKGNNPLQRPLTLSALEINENVYNSVTFYIILFQGCNVHISPVKMSMLVFWVVTPCDYVDTNVSERTASIFEASAWHSPRDGLFSLKNLEECTSHWKSEKESHKVSAHNPTSTTLPSVNSTVACGCFTTLASDDRWYWRWWWLKQGPYRFKWGWNECEAWYFPYIIIIITTTSCHCLWSIGPT